MCTLSITTHNLTALSSKNITTSIQRCGDARCPWHAISWETISLCLSTLYENTMDYIQKQPPIISSKESTGTNSPRKSRRK